MFPESFDSAVNWHAMLALTRAMPDVHLVMFGKYMSWACSYERTQGQRPNVTILRHAMWRDCLGKGQHRVFTAVYDPDNIMPIHMRQGRVLAAMYAESLPFNS